MNDDVRIMLVDDEPHVLSSLQRLLRLHPPASGKPFIVEAYTSPTEAIDAAHERAIAAVICDYRMPGLDGIETLRRLKEVQPLMGRILLSGSREFDTVVDAVNVAEVGRIVIKPWSDAELLSAVRDAIETRRLRLENAELADELRMQRGLISRQEAELRRIEGMWPGITRVEWSADGSICISEKDVLDTRFGHSLG
jgi:two-component system, probable response regulator PhcQ